MDAAEVTRLADAADSLPLLTAQLRRTGADETLLALAVKRYLNRRAWARGIPLNGQFELTPACNLDCRMCYVHLTREQLRGRRILGAAQWEGLMRQAVDAGMLYATLTGGECLGYPGFDRLYLFLHARGVQLNVLTNGVLLDDRRVEFFRKHPPAMLQVTLYSASEAAYARVTGHRVFERVVQNIRRADRAGLPLIVSITPNPYQAEDGEALLNCAAGLGARFEINGSLFAPRHDTGRDGAFRDRDIADYIRLYRRALELKGVPPAEPCTGPLPEAGAPAQAAPAGLRCGGGRNSFTIFWNGDMAPCNRLDDQTARPLEAGFAGAWREVHAAAMAYLLPAECERCAYRRVARGCAAEHRAEAPPGRAGPHMCRWCREMVRAGLARPE